MIALYIQASSGLRSIAFLSQSKKRTLKTFKKIGVPGVVGVQFERHQLGNLCNLALRFGAELALVISSIQDQSLNPLVR